MADTPGPEALRELMAGLHGTASPAQIDAMAAYVEAWELERVTRHALDEQLAQARLSNEALAEQLAAALRQVEVLEKDRKWWQDNAIRRAKRSAARRSGGS